MAKVTHSMGASVKVHGKEIALGGRPFIRGTKPPGSPGPVTYMIAACRASLLVSDGHRQGGGLCPSNYSIFRQRVQAEKYCAELPRDAVSGRILEYPYYYVSHSVPVFNYWSPTLRFDSRLQLPVNKTFVALGVRYRNRMKSSVD